MCMYVCVCIYIYIRTYIYLYTALHIRLCLSLSLYIYICIYTHILIHIHVRIYEFPSFIISVPAFICIYIYTYNIYMYLCSSFSKYITYDNIHVVSCMNIRYPPEVIVLGGVSFRPAAACCSGAEARAGHP